MINCFGKSLLACLVLEATVASFGGVEARFLNLMRLNWLRPFNCLLNKAVVVVGECVSSVFTVQGWGKASNIDFFPDPPTVLVRVT